MSNIKGWKFVAEFDEREGRMDARCFVCGHMTLTDAEISAFERLVSEGILSEDSDFDWNDADEAFHEVMGFSVPKGLAAEFYEGELYLCTFADADTEEEGLADVREQLERHGATVELV